MHPLQKTIDNRWIAANKYTVNQLTAIAQDLDLPSRERVKLAWLNAPQVHAFIKTACAIARRDEMADAYADHLDQLPAFESFCRAVRNGSDTEATPEQKRATASPRWYTLYRRSEHWKRKVWQARNYYGSCVLCASLDNLECHHRHYLTLGNENLKDLSILCSNHHKAIGRQLGIRVPPDCPDNVEVLLRRWGLLKRDSA